MIVKYSLYTYPDGTLYESEDPDGEWFKASDVIAAMGSLVREIKASPSDDPGTVLDRAAIALEARREKIVELETELARRNQLVERSLTCKN